MLSCFYVRFSSIALNGLNFCLHPVPTRFLPPTTTINIHQLSTLPSPTESSLLNHCLAKCCAKEGLTTLCSPLLTSVWSTPPAHFAGVGPVGRLYQLDVDQLLFVIDFLSFLLRHHKTTTSFQLNTNWRVATTVRIASRSSDLTKTQDGSSLAVAPISRP